MQNFAKDSENTPTLSKTAEKTVRMNKPESLDRGLSCHDCTGQSRLKADKIRKFESLKFKPTESWEQLDGSLI